jgi:hypothetical protein
MERRTQSGSGSDTPEREFWVSDSTSTTQRAIWTLLRKSAECKKNHGHEPKDNLHKCHPCQRAYPSLKGTEVRRLRLWRLNLPIHRAVSKCDPTALVRSFHGPRTPFAVDPQIFFAHQPQYSLSLTLEKNGLSLECPPAQHNRNVDNENRRQYHQRCLEMPAIPDYFFELSRRRKRTALL